MKSSRLKYLIIFFSAFIFSFVFFYVIGAIYCDEIWLYGFSANISKGLMIYRDYNVVTTPLYFFLVSVFINLFGNYIMVTHIFDSIIFALIIIMLYKIIRGKVFIMMPMFMFFCIAGYNLLALFFCVLIIFLIFEKKDNDLLIAFIVGLCFITKQNIGVLLFIPCFIYSKKKIKSVCCFMLPFFILSIYLIYNDAFYQFIDYCFLGLFDFREKNLYVDKLFVLLFIINIIYLVYKLWRSNFKDKELFYILSFQLVMYPIFDHRHYLCALFLVIYVLLKSINKKRLLLMIGVFVYFLYFELFFVVDYDISFEKKDIDYLKNNGELEVLAYEIMNYVGDNENFFFTDYYGYYVKMYYDIEISQYDLLVSGNVGYNGMSKKLDELTDLCNKEKCYFFAEDKDNNGEDIVYDQYSEFNNYIRNNYVKVDKLFEFDIYTNYIDE